MPVSLDDRIEISPKLAFRPIEDGGVLVNLDSGDCWELNRTAAQVWQALQESGSARIAVEKLAARYQVARETLERDAVALLEGLQAQGLITAAPTGPVV